MNRRIAVIVACIISVWVMAACKADVTATQVEQVEPTATRLPLATATITASPTAVLPTATPTQLPDFSEIRLSSDKLSNYDFGYQQHIYALDKDVAFLYSLFNETDQFFPDSLLLRTEDGGKSWTEVMDVTPGYAVLQIDFIDGGIGWATVMWTVEGPGKLFLYHTTDYGKSWDELSEIQKDRWWGTPIYLEFTDEYNGILHVDYYYYSDVDDIRIGFLTTNDAGLTWQETGSYPLDGETFEERSKQLDDYYREYNVSLYSKESTGLDGCRWRVDEHDWRVPSFTISRQINTQDNWDIVSILPVKFEYFDGQIFTLVE